MKKFINKLELYFIQSNLKKFTRPTPTFFKSGFYLIKLTLNDGTFGFGEPHPYSGNKNEFIDVLNLIFKKIKKRDINTIDLINIKKKNFKKINKLCLYSCLAAIDSTISFIKNSKKIKINQTYLYASGGMIYKDQNSKILINEMLSYKEKNFSGWKFRPPSPRNFKNHNDRIKSPDWINVKEILNTCELLRLKAGSDFDLMLDVGCRCRNFKDIKYLLEGLNELNFKFVEEPAPRNVISYFQIKNKIKKKPKIAFGECISSVKDAQIFFKNKLIDIFQPDVNLLLQEELRLINILSKKYNIDIIPHSWFNITNFSSNLLFLNSIKKKNKLIEFNILKNPYDKMFMNNSFAIKKGKIFINKKNFGNIDIDYKKIKKNKIYETQK